VGRQWKALLVFVLASLIWYAVVRQMDSGLMMRNAEDVFLCLSERPPGTIYTDEGGLHGHPASTYTVIPLGVECQYKMTDDSITKTFHPNYAAFVFAAFPFLLSLVWAVRLFIHFDRSTRARPHPDALSKPEPGEGL
jgi:hypothetical protein